MAPLSQRRQPVQQPGHGAREDAIVAGQHRQLVVQAGLRFSDRSAQVQVGGRYRLRQAVAQLLQLQGERQEQMSLINLATLVD